MAGKGKSHSFLSRLRKKHDKSAKSSSSSSAATSSPPKSPRKDVLEMPARYLCDPYIDPCDASSFRPPLYTPNYPFPDPFSTPDYSCLGIPSVSSKTSLFEYFVGTSSNDTWSPYNPYELERANLKAYPTSEEAKPSEETPVTRYRTPSPSVRLPPLPPSETSIWKVC